MNIKERIFEKCEPVPVTGCWLWAGATFNHGRPQIRMGDKIVLAHRESFRAFKGEIAEGLCVCHKCDTPLCVNPDHLFLGTHLDNARDKVKKGRQAWNHGEKSGSAKLTNEQVIEIRQMYRKGETSTEAMGRDFGVSGRQIRYIVSGQEWAHLPGGATWKEVA